MLRLLRGAAPAALLLLVPGCDPPGAQADALAQEANQRAEAGDRAGALQAIHQAIALRDNNADYFLLLASIELRSGNPVEAFLAAGRALELDAANVDALSIVANVGMQIGQIDDAEDSAQRILALEPTSVVGLQVKGLVELYRNRTAQAAATAQELLRISPTNEAGTIIMVRVLAKDGKLEEARQLLEETIGNSSATPSFLITQINLNRSLRRPEDMARAFEQLAEQVPNRSMTLRLDEINLNYMLGRKERARELSNALLASSVMEPRDIEIMIRMWWEYDRVPFTRESIRVAKDWSDPVALLLIGRYLLWQGEPQLADDLYFNVPPGIRPIGIGINLRASEALGRTEVARKTTDQVLALDADNIDALLLRSEYLEKAGRLDRAIEVAQRAMNSDQTDPEVYVILARLHAKSGANWRANQIFGDGLDAMPQNFLLIERYTQFLHDSGNKNRAVSASRAFARALPSSVRAWTIMARQCDWAGDAQCKAEAARGKEAAATRYTIDDPPGTAPDRGLLGRF